MFTVCVIAYIVIVFVWYLIAAMVDNRKMVETAKKLHELTREMGKEISMDDCLLAYCRGNGFHLPISYWFFTIGGALAIAVYCLIN